VREKRGVIVFLTLIFSIFFFTSNLFAQQPQLTVKLIEIQGNKRVDKNTILFKLKTKEGEPFSVEKTREDVKSLMETGFFEDVIVDAEPFEGGIKLTYKVKERPLVGRIKIKGNKKIKRDELRKELRSFPFSIYNENIVNENITKITQLYQSKGYYNTKVEVIKQKRRGRLDLTYKITEGKKAHVAKIDFVGNKTFGDRTLKKQMLTKEKNLWNWATSIIGRLLGKPSTYYYIPDLLKVDLMKVREFYRDNGFLEVLVGEPQVKVQKDEIFIKVPIEEGSRYKVKKVDLILKEDDPFKPEEIKKFLKLKEGEWYSAGTMRRDVSNLTDLYGSKGYVNADIRPLIDVDSKQHMVKVAYRVEKGQKYYVGRIEVRGNIKTRDKVIRREVGLAEGDVMNTLALKSAKDRLNRLGYFSEVEIETKPRKGNLEDVIVSVEEQPTGSLMLGGGFSTTESVGGMISLSEKNLFGKGQNVILSGNFTGRRVEYSLDFFDPYIFDRPLSLALSSHHLTYEFDTFDETTLGLSVVVGKRLWNWYTTASIGYEFESVDISGVDDDAPEFIHDQKGKNVSSAVLLSLAQDTRNSSLLPTAGFRRVISLKVAGLGGDEYYYKVIGDVGWYKSFDKFIKGSVFHIRTRVGFINPLPLGADRERPVYERFFVGGQETVRGFDEDEASPEEDGQAYGGTKELIVNLEYLFPLVGGLRGLLFYDAGAAFDNGEKIGIGGLRHALGVGLRFVTPFGPIKLDLGFKLDRKKGESLAKIHFSAGTMF